MRSYSEKIDEVILHFVNKDIHLGFRLLVGCVLDTQNLAHFKSCLALNEWKEQETRTEEAVINACVTYLKSLRGETVVSIKTTTPLLQVTTLSKRYPKGNFTLGPVTMQIHPGEIWGLVGENGNGKTTLLRMLARDLSLDSGTLTYSADFPDASDYELRTRLAYIPQRTPRWFGSLKMNLKLTATHYGITGEANEIWVMIMIVRFGLYPYRNHDWNELSSGYKMRFELARTFLRAPKLLLLDEPLANLDILAQQIILEDLRSLARSISNPTGIVLSSQQLFEVEKISDRILFLKNGAPQLLHDTLVSLHKEHAFLAELEVNATREQLIACLNVLKINQLSYNGGQYIIEFFDADGMKALMQCLIQGGITVKYIRDISASSRRLFTQ